MDLRKVDLRLDKPRMSIELFERFRDLEAYVGWDADDVARIHSVADHVRQQMHQLVDDFYAEIEKHPDATRVITGGAAQVARLKKSLWNWLDESLQGRDSPDYINRRWRIGLRHAEIGLNPAYTSAAMSRLRNGIVDILATLPNLPADEFRQLVQSFNKLFDLDLAIIQDAYESEYLKREKLAEHERSEVKFRRLVEAAACLVIILRGDGSIAYFSPYSVEVTGHVAAEAYGQSFLDLLIPASAREEMAEAIAATFAGQPAKAYEKPLIRRDRSRRWLVWNAQRLDDFDGGPAVLAVGHDFTERREAQERLLRSERLAGIGQMVAGIAHESRNALQRIQSCSEMLEFEVEGNHEALRLVCRLQEAQDNLRRLFDEVRGFAAPIHLERTPCRIESIWHEAWQLLEVLHRGRQSKFIERVEVANPVVEVDRFRMVQVFRNLLENALSACADPVVIEITCREVELNGLPALQIAVADNGPGLTPEAHRNAFEPFFTTKTKGTGLGMAIARRIVEAHGGEIAIGHSAVTGAEFVMTLLRTSP
jgi:two-component system, LuxR family, sensor kinase FixL